MSPARLEAGVSPSRGFAREPGLELLSKGEPRCAALSPGLRQMLFWHLSWGALLGQHLLWERKLRLRPRLGVGGSEVLNQQEFPPWDQHSNENVLMTQNKADGRASHRDEEVMEAVLDAQASPTLYQQWDLGHVTDLIGA